MVHNCTNSTPYSADVMTDLDPYLLKLTSFIKPLPSVADRVLYLARQEPVDFKEITRVIDTDPALSTIVMSLANSPMYNSGRRTISTLDRAIVVLGQGRIMDSVMAYMTRSIRENSLATWPLGDLNFWKHSISVATSARMLAERMQIPAAQKCFIAGLIHDMGKLALLNYDPPGYQCVLEEVLHKQVPIEFVELGAFGVTHAQLSGQISRRWKLPIHFMNAIAFHHDSPDQICGTLANVVRVANLLSKIAGYSDGGNPYNMISADLLMPHPRISQHDIQEILIQLPGVVKELSVLILGSSSNEEQSSILKKNKEEVYVSVGVSNGEERLLLRYMAAALGYKTSATKLESDEFCAHVFIMDYMPSNIPQGKQIIDFSLWRNEQRNMPDNRLHIKSLRNWLSCQLEGVLSVAA